MGSRIPLSNRGPQRQEVSQVSLYSFLPQGWMGKIWVSANGTTYRNYTIEELLRAARK